ncbi:Os01g0900750 [Oryza sativa Japonica Group]|uniref:Os01g0900750 protein n=1 Tax=Oryza sativa subsp. japonica TaxID=39947 RepID=A0A0P0VBS6_ORYSJ|nr:hypothetical protein EE612_007404 [Oryza sativa]BAS75744.1 Os01g0900750 [Oryza sativa Japonica Group]
MGHQSPSAQSSPDSPCTYTSILSFLFFLFLSLSDGGRGLHLRVLHHGSTQQNLLLSINFFMRSKKKIYLSKKKRCCFPV